MLPSLVRPHAAPAKVVLAPGAEHVGAALILLYSYITAWASAHIIPDCEAAEGCFLRALALAFMPRQLAFEACGLGAVLTGDFISFLVNFLLDFLTARAVRAPNQLWILVYTA